MAYHPLPLTHRILCYVQARSCAEFIFTALGIVVGSAKDAPSIQVGLGDRELSGTRVLRSGRETISATGMFVGRCVETRDFFFFFF